MLPQAPTPLVRCRNIKCLHDYLAPLHWNYGWLTCPRCGWESYYIVPGERRLAKHLIRPPMGFLSGDEFDPHCTSCPHVHHTKGGGYPHCDHPEVPKTLAATGVAQWQASVGTPHWCPRLPKPSPDKAIVRGRPDAPWAVSPSIDIIDLPPDAPTITDAAQFIQKEATLDSVAESCGIVRMPGESDQLFKGRISLALRKVSLMKRGGCKECSHYRQVDLGGIVTRQRRCALCGQGFSQREQDEQDFSDPGTMAPPDWCPLYRSKEI